MKDSSQDVFQVSCEIFGAILSYSATSKHPTEKSLIVYLLVLVFNSMLIIPTILLNAVSIITILKSTQLSSKPCYFIILVQSAIDSAVGLFGIPLYLAYMLGQMGVHSNCIVIILGHTTTVLMVEISTIVQSALTLERYIAVLHPFAYKMAVTKRRILVCICIASLVFFSVIVTLSHAFHRLMAGWTMAQSTVFFFFIAFAYTRIFLVVKKLARFQRNVHDVHAYVSERNSTRTMVFLQDIKHAKTCFTVVLCYVVFHYMPVMLMFFFNHPKALATLCLLNSCVNSVIFFWTRAMLRKQALKFLKSLKT